MNQQEIDACVAAILSYAPQTSHAVAVEAARRALLQRDRPQPQAATWNGPEDGLPPVGLEVEAWFADNVGPDPVWVPFEVLYLSDHSIVFKTAVGEHQYRLPRFKARGVKLRPIRTAEQLAAEERERQAEQLAFVMSGHRDRSKDCYLSMAKIILDAGYTPPVQP